MHRRAMVARCFPRKKGGKNADVSGGSARRTTAQARIACRQVYLRAGCGCRRRSYRAVQSSLRLGPMPARSCAAAESVLSPRRRWRHRARNRCIRSPLPPVMATQKARTQVRGLHFYIFLDSHASFIYIWPTFAPDTIVLRSRLLAKQYR